MGKYNCIFRDNGSLKSQILKKHINNIQIDKLIRRLTYLLTKCMVMFQTNDMLFLDLTWQNSFENINANPKDSINVQV